MKPEEAIKILRDTPIDIKSERDRDIHTLYATAQMMAIEALEEVQKYRKIGTVEECREAVKKQEPKKVIKDSEISKWYVDVHFCPSCGKLFTGIEKLKYCYHCGQKFQWNKNLEVMKNE